MHFPLDISENLHDKLKKKTLRMQDLWQFFLLNIKFKLLFDNFCQVLSVLNTFANLNDNSTAILKQAETT